MKPSEILRAAKERLTPDTWGQGSGGGCLSDGRTCAGIAIDDARFELSATPAAREAAILFVYDVIGTNGIIDWNDEPGRTLEQVHAAFDKAIALAESRGE